MAGSPLRSWKGCLWEKKRELRSVVRVPGLVSTGSMLGMCPRAAWSDTWNSRKRPYGQATGFTCGGRSSGHRLCKGTPPTKGSESRGGHARPGGAGDADGRQRQCDWPTVVLLSGQRVQTPLSPGRPSLLGSPRLSPTLHVSLAGRDDLFRGQPPLLHFLGRVGTRRFCRRGLAFPGPSNEWEAVTGTFPRWAAQDLDRGRGGGRSSCPHPGSVSNKATSCDGLVRLSVALAPE